MTGWQGAAWVIILAGGRGTRLGRVHLDTPKPLIPCHGRPFIEWVIEYFRRQGLDRFVISVGHLGHVTQAHFTARSQDGTQIRLVSEREALGTGGAIRHAWRALPPGTPVVVTNGDSLVLANLAPAARVLEEPSLDGAIVAVEMNDASRFGTLEVGQHGLLTGFREKQPGRGLINAGVYVLKPHLLDDFPDGPGVSLEQRVFPEMLGRGRRIRVCPVPAPFLDIGTPESLRRAVGFIRQHLDRGA